MADVWLARSAYFDWTIKPPFGKNDEVRADEDAGNRVGEGELRLSSHRQDLINLCLPGAERPHSQLLEVRPA